jgi:hypothetical protein
LNELRFRVDAVVVFAVVQRAEVADVATNADVVGEEAHDPANVEAELLLLVKN